MSRSPSIRLCLCMTCLLYTSEKALKAFKMIGRPLFVEHTGLFIDKINQLPGGLTQVFWDKLQADKFAELFGADVGESKAKAITTICYIDGKNTHIFDGEVEGSITVSYTHLK